MADYVSRKECSNTKTAIWNEVTTLKVGMSRMDQKLESVSEDVKAVKASQEKLTLAVVIAIVVQIAMSLMKI